MNEDLVPAEVDRIVKAVAEGVSEATLRRLLAESFTRLTMVWENELTPRPRPYAPLGDTAQTGRGVWAARLEPLKLRPRKWATVFEWPPDEKHSSPAAIAASQLRAGRYTGVDPADFEFVGMRARDGSGGSVLLARFVGRHPKDPHAAGANQRSNEK